MPGESRRIVFPEDVWIRRFSVSEGQSMLLRAESDVSDTADTQRNLLSKEGSVLPRFSIEDPVKLRALKGSASLKHYKGYLKLTLCGFILMALAYTIYIVDPLEFAKTKYMNIEEGTFLYSLWQKPPVKIFIKVFIFNVTNAKEFLMKKDLKLKVHEIGPYVYSEQLVNTNVTFNNNHTVSYRPIRTLRFEPGLSVGNPMEDLITVSNIPFLGITSMLHNSSMTLNLGLSGIVSFLDTQPFVDVSVHDFLWGYDEQLVKLASKILPNWITFPKFGLLDRLLDEGNNTVTMHVADKSKKDVNKKLYSIDQMNGYPGLPQWGYKSGYNRTTCNNVQGAFEGYVYPRHISPNDTFFLYRKSFCRTLPLVYNKSGFSDRGIPVFIYKLAENALDSPIMNPDNACYCKNTNKPCLPSGLSDLSPCYYGEFR
uniref:Scavenger receptor class B member 1 n=1 Tax=Clastoptera arizonana TaxID=38151 RepID=A0A1B6DPI6_9HEMI